MSIILTKAGVRKCFPKAPTAVVEAFVRNQQVLRAAGLLDNRFRLAYCFANLGHETSGFTIRNLTENIGYTHERAAEVWPNRFRSAADVASRFGSEPGWQRNMFDEIYGNRMGNRPGTRDGSRYIGRGGPQITGRDGYVQVGNRAGLPLENSPELATRAENQPAIAAAFWQWKNLGPLADAHRFTDVVVRWNGGKNGLADRQNWLIRILAICEQMEEGELPDIEPKVPAEVSVPGTSGGGTIAVGVEQGWSVGEIAIAVIAVAIITFVGVMIFKRIKEWRNATASGDSSGGAGDVLPGGRDYPMEEGDDTHGLGSPLGRRPDVVDDAVGQSVDGPGGPSR